MDESDSIFGLIAYSSNGKAWTMVKNTTFGGIPSSIKTIVWGGDKFVAGGHDGKMAYSPDGINWTAVKNSAFDDNHISTIVWNGNKFVAVGGTTVLWKDNDSKSRSKIAYSPDGITWTAVTNNPFDNSSINGIAWGNNRFVACGYNGKMAYSSDGIDWTAVINSTFGNSTFSNIVWGKDKFVAGGGIWEEKVGMYGRMTYSFDGITWTAMTSGPLRRPNDDWYYLIKKIVWGNNTFIATGGDWNMTEMAYSPDGINWTFATNYPFTGDDTDAILWADCRFIVGNGWNNVTFSK
jgi:hypothetical protein